MKGNIAIAETSSDTEDEDSEDFDYSEPNLPVRNRFTPKSVLPKSRAEEPVQERSFILLQTVTVFALFVLLTLTIFSEVEVDADVWSYETEINFSATNFLASLQKI